MRPGSAHHLTQQVAGGSQGVVGLLAAELGCKVFAYVSSTQRGGVRFGGRPSRGAALTRGARGGRHNPSCRPCEPGKACRSYDFVHSIVMKS